MSRVARGEGTTQDPSQLKPKDTPTEEDTEANAELLNTRYGSAEETTQKESEHNEAEEQKQSGKKGKSVEDLSIAKD